MKFRPTKLRETNLKIENELIRLIEKPMFSLIDFRHENLGVYILNEISGGRLFDPSFIGSNAAPHDLHPVVLML